MKKMWPGTLWAGLALVLAGAFSFPVLVGFPATRDFAWANFALLAAGLAVLWVSLRKSFRQAQVYRGKVLGSIVFGLSLAATAFFAFGIFYLARVPFGSQVPNVGERAPGFSLPNQEGKIVTLNDLLRPEMGAGSGTLGRGALLIFYRGHW